MNQGEAANAEDKGEQRKEPHLLWGLLDMGNFLVCLQPLMDKWFSTAWAGSPIRRSSLGCPGEAIAVLARTGETMSQKAL